MWLSCTVLIIQKNTKAVYEACPLIGVLLLAGGREPRRWELGYKKNPADCPLSCLHNSRQFSFQPHIETVCKQLLSLERAAQHLPNLLVWGLSKRLTEKKHPLIFQNNKMTIEHATIYISLLSAHYIWLWQNTRWWQAHERVTTQNNDILRENRAKLHSVIKGNVTVSIRVSGRTNGR